MTALPDRGTADRTDLLSIVIPLYNEEQSIAPLFERLRATIAQLDVDAEIVCVDDGSHDGTAAACRRYAVEDPQIKLVQLSRNFGHQAAITAGMDHAVGDALVLMDGDLQDPPEAIPLFLTKWREGYQVVYAIRRCRPEGWVKRMAYWAFYRLLGRIAAVHVPSDSGDFGLIDRRVAQLLRQMPERNRFLRGLRSWVGLRQIGVEVDRGERVAGAPKYTFAKLLGLAVDGLISFSNVPLRLATRTGFVVSGVSFLFALWVVILRLGWGIAIAGWASLIVVVTFLGGIQLITMGILGEYIARIYDEVKRRPLYVVASTVNVDPEDEQSARGVRFRAEGVERRL